jgi:hypothetical protein
VSIAFLVLADRAELLLLPRLLLVLLLVRLPLVVLLFVRPRVACFPLLLVVLLRLNVEEEDDVEDFRGISRLAQHNI